MKISESPNRRRLRSGLLEKVEQDENGGGSSSSLSSQISPHLPWSSPSNNNMNATRPLHFPRARRRRADQVEKISKTECLFTTSLATQNGGSTFAVGNMFTVVPSVVMEVLTLEFDAQVQAGSNLAAKVYFKEGDFSGATSDPSRWTLLADTTAQLSPDGKGAILPARDFTPATLSAGKQYSFYLHIQGGSDIMKVRSSDSLIGEAFFKDDLGLLALQVGVSLSDGPFPNSFNAPAEFSGRIHYKSTQDCDSVRTNSVVELEFAVNENPDEAVMEELSEAVQKAIDAVIILDPDLIKFDKFHSLEIAKVDSKFMGRSEEKCPPEFDTCSLINSRVQFLHLPTVTAGELWLDLLDNDERIAESVIAQNDFETQYVGSPVIRMDFIITLTGVPAGSRMNTLQRRFFQTVTASFLDRVTEDVPIYTTEIVDEVAAGGRRGLQSLGLRGSYYIRHLNEGLQVVTTVSGSGSNPGDILAPVLEAIGLNSEQYIQELAGQTLRPGNINQGNSGDMFTELTGASIVVKPDGFGEGPKTPGSSSTTGGEEAEKDSDVWLYLSILGVIASVVWLAYRFYRDFFYSPKTEETKQLTGDDHFEASRRPSFDRRPSFEGRRPPLRSRSLDRLPRSMEGLSSQSAHPVRPNSAANSLPNSAHVPRNSAGAKGRGLKPHKSMPLNLMRQSLHDKNKSDEEKTPAGGTPKNKAGAKRGIQPTKSLPDMLRPQNVDDQSVSNASKHSTRSTPASRAKPLVNRAGQNRGLRANHSMPVRKGSKHSVRSVPNLSLPGKKHPPKKQASGISDSSAHSVRSVPNLSLPAKKHPPKKQASGISNSSGHSVRSVPNLSLPAKKHPPKKQASVISNSSGHSVRSVPNLSLPGNKKHPPQKQASSLSKSSGQSVGSVEKHAPKNQAGQRRGTIQQRSRSLPTVKIPAPGRKEGTFQNSSMDSWSSSDESDLASSEESDFDEATRMNPLSPKKAKKRLSSRKSRNIPDNSESSEESDCEENSQPFVLYLDESERVDTQAPVKNENSDQTFTPTEIDLTDDESSIEDKISPEMKTSKKKKKNSKNGKEKKKKKSKLLKAKSPEKKASKKTKMNSSSSLDHVVPQPESVVKAQGKTTKKKPKNRTGKARGITASKSLPDLSKQQVTLKDMVKNNDPDESSSSSESEDETRPRDGPPKVILRKFHSGTPCIPDDVSEITASAHSSSKPNVEQKRDPEGKMAAMRTPIDASGPAEKEKRMTKTRNHLQDVSARPVDLSSPSAELKSPESLPKINPKGISEGKAATTGTPSPLESSASAAREMRLARIRSHLRDVSTQPVDLSSTLMRPAHLRDADEVKTPEPLPKVKIPRTRSGDFGEVGNIRVVQRTKSAEFGKNSRPSDNAETASLTASMHSHHHAHKSWRDLVHKEADPSVTKSEPVRGQIRRTRSDDRLTPATLGGAEKESARNAKWNTAASREPARGQIRRTRSDERLVPLKLTTRSTTELRRPALPIRGRFKRANSDERRGAISAHLNAILGDDSGPSDEE